MTSKIKIAPSILSADFAILGEEIKAIDEAGADFIHVDVMDGHFVSNITIGPCVVKALRPFSKLLFDVHLMIEPVDPYIEAFAKAGADIITVHAEATDDLKKTVGIIKSQGKKAGVSIKPGTKASALDGILDEIDLVLVMTVEPGFGGQSFMDDQLGKIAEIRKMIDKTDKDIFLEVDGGIDADTAKLVIEAGADVLVAGSATFKGGKGEYAENIKGLRG